MLVDPTDQEFIERVVELAVEHRGEGWQGIDPPPFFIDTIAHIMAISILTVTHPRNIVDGFRLAIEIAPVQELIDAILVRVLEIQQAQQEARNGS